MRSALLLVPVLGLLVAGAGCVLDRTGRSAATDLERQLALHAVGLEQLEGRVVQLEEIVRVRGQQEALKMENLDQVRAEVRRLRGDLEVVRHDLEVLRDEVGATGRDVDFRLTWLEQRAEALEAALGLPPPSPPGADQVRGPEGAPGEGPETEAQPVPGGEEPAADGQPASQPSLDELLQKAREHLQAGRLAAARAMAERAIQAWPDEAGTVEARFLLAETLYLDGRYQQAVLRYEDVIAAAPEGPWAARAMVRQGQCFKALGRDKEAALFWEDVLARYPDTEAAAEARKLLGR